MKCPKCNGEMTEGVLHVSHGLISLKEIAFIPKGQPKLSLTKRTVAKTKSYCCNNCGYIETYLDK